MNVRKGFNRIAIILWVLYAVGLLIVYPLYEDIKMRRLASETSFSWLRSCEAQHLKKCDQDFERREVRDRQLYRIGSFWREWADWNLLWFLPVVIMIPPLIAYGIAFAARKVGAWVYSGFKT